MRLTAGTRLGPYEIVGPLGAGGMGEVYRARDSRIGREVAIKVLPQEFVADQDRLQRFEREARAIGALSHPNLLVLHDVGSSDVGPYLVPSFSAGRRCAIACVVDPLRSAMPSTGERKSRAASRRRTSVGSSIVI